MSTTLDQIREQQHQTWDTFSAGWKRWDALVLSWLGPFGEAMIRNAKLKDRDDVLDVASGTGSPGSAPLRACRMAPSPLQTSRNACSK
jgi:hypothetical protein